MDPYFGQAAAEAALKTAGHATGLTVQVLLVAFLTNLVLVIFRKLTKVRISIHHWSHHGATICYSNLVNGFSFR